MSFDIYGNDLKRGYCEVHPNVADEYPCSLCMANSKIKEVFNPSQELEYHLGQCQERIEELEARINELEQAQSKWISVEDRLPEIDWQNILVYCDGGNIQTTKYHNERAVLKW